MNIIFYTEGKYLSWKSQKSSYLQFIRLYMLCALSELFITILWTSSAQQLPIAAYLQMALFHLLLWQVYLLLSWKKSVKQNKNKLQNWQLFIPFNATAARSILPLIPLFSRKLFFWNKKSHSLYGESLNDLPNVADTINSSDYIFLIFS